MKKNRLFSLIFLFSFNGFAITFKEAVEILKKHESVESINSKSTSLAKEAGLKGSWGDPMLKIAAKNYPKDTLKDDQTTMTGIEFGISQKISLTTKYGNIEDAFNSLSQAKAFEAKDQTTLLTKALWEVLIVRRKISKERNILEENLTWISKILTVSKKLYANGKISQQALLDIHIRKSELEGSLSNKSFELSQVDDQLHYLLGTNENILDEKTVPWNILEKIQTVKKDFRELSLKQKIISKEYLLTAAKLNYVPDLSVSLAVTKRSNIDGNGDFVAAQISFPLPFSSATYSGHGKAVHEKHAAIKQYENYKKSNHRDASILKKEILKLKSELEILTQKTIEFAKNSRTITSKSYGLGNSSYIELLQSEIKLQKILLKKVMLESKIDLKKVTLKYVLGDSLYE